MVGERKTIFVYLFHKTPKPFFHYFLSKITQIPTNVDKKFLYFNVVNRGENKTITVEGGGVNATVIQSDIAATNGFVHIIDHVLGVPYMNIQQKLETDPMLK
jgi:fasciclin 1